MAGRAAAAVMAVSFAYTQAPPAAFAGDAIAQPLTATRGDAARGRGILIDRQVGMCLLCHRGPFAEEQMQGTVGPDLTGVGARLSAGQIRLRIVDAARVNPSTVMPAYFRTDELTRVAPAYQGRTILTAQQIEDVVAFLTTLTER